MPGEEKGKWKVTQYATKWKAMEAWKNVEDAKVKVGKDASAAVLDKRILRWVDLEAKLQDHRLTLEEVALERLKSLKHVETKKKLKDALSAYLVALKKNNRSATWRQSIRSTCSRFADTVGKDKLCDAVAEKEVKDFLEGLGVAVRTKENMRLRLSAFFTYCVEEKHMSTAPIPKSYRSALAVDEAYSSIDYFTIPQVRELLLELDSGDTTPISDMRCFVVLGLFSGIRPQEFRKKVTYKGKEHLHFLKWEDVDMKKKVVTISKHLSKTKKTRKIPLPDAAVEWLLRWVDDSFPAKDKAVVPEWHSEKYSRLKKASSITFTHDVLRHTFGTYRVALVGASKAATEMGNSGGVVLSHYAEAVDESEAKEYFNLTPEEASLPNTENIKKSG